MKVESSLKIFLDNDVEVTPKHIALLDAVQKTGSITKAANYAGISYKNAWDSLAELDVNSKNPLIVRISGNKKNSGSELSEYGQKLLSIYRQIDKLQNNFLKDMCENLTIDGLETLNLQQNSIKLSARNQIYVTITQIKQDPLSSSIFAKTSNGDIIVANITEHSEKSLGLEVGKEVLFIFKAPCVKIIKNFDDENFNNSDENFIGGVIKDVRIGSATAEILIDIGNYQNITATLKKDEAMDLRLGAGDEIEIFINPADIVVGV